MENQMLTYTARAVKALRSSRFPFWVAVIFMLVCAQSLVAQGNITFTLSKSSNGTSPIPSGQPFTYTLTYGWSGGAPGTLTITDAVPAELDVISTLPGSPSG